MSGMKIIAKVGGENIYYWELEDAITSYSIEVLKKNVEELTDTEYNEAFNEAFEKLVGSELFFLEAIEAGFTTNDNEINAHLSDFMKNFPDSLSFNRYLAERGIDIDSLKSTIKKNIIKDRFINALLKRIPPVTKNDAENYYEKTKDKISLPPRLTFYKIFVENPKQEERERFKAAFATLAGKHFEPVFAEKIMEDIPLFLPKAKYEKFLAKPIDELHPSLVRYLYGIEEKSFSNIDEGDEYIGIIYMLEKIMYVPMNSEEGKKEAAKYLSIIRLKRILDAYVDSLKEKYTIEKFI